LQQERGRETEERRKLVDVYMEKFKEVFGKYPTAIGSWFIDAYTLPPTQLSYW